MGANHIIFALAVSLSFSFGLNLAFGADSSGRVNWFEICRNPVVDGMLRGLFGR
jgi:hypothetical protein